MPLLGLSRMFSEFIAFVKDKLYNCLAKIIYQAASLIIIILTFSFSSQAAGLTCSGATDVGGNYEIPHSGINITAPNTGNGFALLYTANKSVIGGSGHINMSCNGSASVGFTITDVPAGTIYSYSGYTIYPTTVKGIGVSFNNADPMSSYGPMTQWPNVSVLFTSLPGYAVDTWVTIRVWKTPEFTYQTNAINFTGPRVNEVVQANGGNSISGCPAARLDAKTCVYLSRTLTGNAQFMSGTCQLTNSAQVVKMGSVPFSQVDTSPWVDASFSVKCPTAYGYGGSVSDAHNIYNTEDGSVTGNNTKNNTVKIQIIPYTNIVDAVRGIMSVASGGAEGVGIQLAWGSVSEQSNTPGNPVKFGTAINISTLNTNFSNGPYAYGSNASSSDANLIKLAARYVKVADEVKPGQANATVEVMASYE